MKYDAAIPFNCNITVKEWVRGEVAEAARVLQQLSLSDWWSFEFEPHPRAFSARATEFAASLPIPRIPFMWYFPPKCFICGSRRVDSDHARSHAIGHDVCGICRQRGFWFHFEGEA